MFFYYLYSLLCFDEWKLNTSNEGKLKEFQKIFSRYFIKLTATRKDLKEIDSDPVSVVAHKASQVDEKVLIEDTSLEIEGCSVGINIRWLLDHLDAYVHKKAIWTVLLAYREGDTIKIFKGEVKGKIVPSRGCEGFGFDPYFLPDNSSYTLAEKKPDGSNARALAVESFIKKKIFKEVPAIYTWDGNWQAP